MTEASSEKQYATTRMLTRIPPSIINHLGGKVKRCLVLAPSPLRLGEGGLRTQGLFKISQPGKPLLSILTVVFNSARFLEETILSVSNQDYENLEFIIVDGGSTDGTLDIIRRYEHAINYWVSEPDKGISDAFNKAVILAAGDYVNFQGAGDYLVSNSVVSEMIDGVDANNDMLICGRVQRVAETVEKKVIWIAPKHYTPDFDKRSLLLRMPFPHQALFTHKKMFDLYGLFDTHNVFTMDYEHLLRAYKSFPAVKLKDIQFSAWREGGVGTGRALEWLREQAKIKRQNTVAPLVVLRLLDYWIFFKYYLKKYLLRLKAKE
jgi:glycosyltransferase involved in cell wall biosynthesis